MLSGLDILRALRRDGYEPRHPLWVGAFMDEEGTRFGTALFGSRAFVGGDFSGLDPHPADFNLIVQATENLQRAVRAITATIAGKIQKIVRIGAEGILDEPLCLFLGRVEVTKCAKG